MILERIRPARGSAWKEQIMTKDRTSGRAGGTNSRPLNDTIAQTGDGLPDEAVGPGELGPAENTGLADNPQAKAMAAKLKREAAQWRDRDQAEDSNRVGDSDGKSD
jgi:hypothetical protein